MSSPYSTIGIPQEPYDKLSKIAAHQGISRARALTGMISADFAAIDFAAPSDPVLEVKAMSAAGVALVVLHMDDAPLAVLEQDELEALAAAITRTIATGEPFTLTSRRAKRIVTVNRDKGAVALGINGVIRSFSAAAEIVRRLRAGAVNASRLPEVQNADSEWTAIRRANAKAVAP